MAGKVTADLVENNGSLPQAGVDHAVVHVRRGSTTLQTAFHSASERNGTGLPIVAVSYTHLTLPTNREV